MDLARQSRGQRAGVIGASAGAICSTVFRPAVSDTPDTPRPSLGCTVFGLYSNYALRETTDLKLIQILVIYGGSILTSACRCW